MVLKRPGWRVAAVSLSLLTGLGTVGLSPAASAHDRDRGDDGDGVRVVATGLDNPRHLTFSGGALYVAEAGEGGGGSTPCYESPEGDAFCGTTGAITRIKHGRQTQVVTGLPSAAGADGGGAAGPLDLHVRGKRFTVVIGLGADPLLREGQPRNVRRLATLATGRLGSSKLRVVADLGAYEADENPDGTDLDSNPVGLLRKGRSTYVADAGGNSVVRVRKNGRLSTAAVLPRVPLTGVPGGIDPVPTAVAYGPDGALYVSQLTGGPFPQGAASIWRIERGEDPVPYATGLTMVTDLAFARDGSLYVVQLTDAGLGSGPPIGSVVRIPRGGGSSHSTVEGGLVLPYGIALHKGAAYVTTHSAEADNGQVVRIPLHR